MKTSGNGFPSNQALQRAPIVGFHGLRRDNFTGTYTFPAVAENQPGENQNRMDQVNSLDEFAARLKERVRVWSCPGDRIADEPGWDAEFNEMALELFRLQFENNAAYRRFCQARGLGPATISRWSQIPAIPAKAFKELDLTCIAKEQRTTVFLSSGTTGQASSRHYHHRLSLQLYEASLLEWFKQAVLQGRIIRPKRFLVLTPSGTEAPHSSLVHMFEVLSDALAPEGSCFTGRAEGDAWSLDRAATVSEVRKAQETRRPLMLLGTAFSYVHLVDYLAEQQTTLRLPAGSLVLETGGYKGRSRTLPKLELQRLLESRLGIPRSEIVCEYGMSELSSQAYERTAESRPCVESNREFHFAPWARQQIVSPENGQPVAVGETGLIKVFDLANVYSALAIQTEDLGVRREHGFELIGRTAQAEPRGCSLMASR